MGNGYKNIPWRVFLLEKTFLFFYFFVLKTWGHFDNMGLIMFWIFYILEILEEVTGMSNGTNLTDLEMWSLNPFQLFLNI